MSLVKPSFVESMFHNYFMLDPDRPKYYNNVFAQARKIFMQLGFDDKARLLQKKIHEHIEKPFNAPMFAVLDGYYNFRFMYSKKAFCKIGEGVDSKEITRYEMTIAFERIKEWCDDEIINITPYIRFTQRSEFLG